MIELAIFMYAVGYFTYFVYGIHVLCDECMERSLGEKVIMIAVDAIICLIWPLFALEYICKKLIKG